jgi:hypothetical protein
MAFFTADPDFETQAARKAFADDQLEDSRFVYENPENDNNPGAFLSEYFLRIFATHLNAIAGHEKVDTLDCGMMGLETALALTAAAVSRVFSSDLFLTLFAGRARAYLGV